MHAYRNWQVHKISAHGTRVHVCKCTYAHVSRVHMCTYIPKGIVLQPGISVSSFKDSQESHTILPSKGNMGRQYYNAQTKFSVDFWIKTTERNKQHKNGHCLTGPMRNRILNAVNVNRRVLIPGYQKNMAKDMHIQDMAHFSKQHRPKQPRSGSTSRNTVA